MVLHHGFFLFGIGKGGFGKHAGKLEGVESSGVVMSVLMEVRRVEYGYDGWGLWYEESSYDRNQSVMISREGIYEEVAE